MDFNIESKEEIISVDHAIVRKLKPYQAEGIQFMWRACFESVERLNADLGSGCILAHCMGLGMHYILRFNVLYASLAMQS